MKKVFLFLIVISFIVCEVSKDRIEELKKQRLENDRIVAECIKNNKETSSLLRKLIDENPDNIRRAFHPKDQQLERSDRDIIKNCRKIIFDKMREEIKERRKEERRKDPHTHDL